MDPLGASYVLLWLLVLVQGVVIVFLLRQVGAIYLGGRDAIDRDGVALGQPLPDIEGFDARGGPQRVADFRGGWMVVVYTVPTCQICREILPTMARLVRRVQDQVRFVLVLEADPTSLESYLAETGYSGDALSIDRSVAKHLRVRVSPFVHVVDPAGVIRSKGLINSVDHLEHLLVTGGLDHDALARHVELKHGVAG